MSPFLVIAYAKPDLHPLTSVALCLGLTALLVVPLILIKLFIVPRTPRECPYCASEDMLLAKRFDNQRQQAMHTAVTHVLSRDCDVNAYYVCRSCHRVVDPDIMLDADPDIVWAQVEARGATRTPTQVEVYPPVPCRACARALIISGGPPADRVCPECNTLHNWWKDQDTGYLLFTSVPAEFRPDEGSQEPGTTAPTAPNSVSA